MSKRSELSFLKADLFHRQLVSAHFHVHELERASRVGKRCTFGVSSGKLVNLTMAFWDHCAGAFFHYAQYCSERRLSVHCRTEQHDGKQILSE